MTDFYLFFFFLLQLFFVLDGFNNLDLISLTVFV